MTPLSDNHSGIVAHDAAAADDWWARAQQLERNNQLDEAEAVIAEAIPHIGSGVQTARLYAERMERLKAQGDRTGAADAHERASTWIWRYASWATSGGEGVALSNERDRFLAQLGPVP